MTTIATTKEAREFQIYKEAFLLGVGYNKELRAVDFRTAINLSSYMNHKTYTCFPGAGTLSGPLPIHERSTKRSLKALTDHGHLRRSRRWNKEKRCWSSSVYLPLIPDYVMPALEIRFHKETDVLETIKAVRARLLASNSSGVDLSLPPDNDVVVNDGVFVTRVVAGESLGWCGTNVPITSDLTSDLTSLTYVSSPSASTVREEQREEKKGVAEEERQESKEPLSSPDSSSFAQSFRPSDERSRRPSYDELRQKFGPTGELSLCPVDGDYCCRTLLFCVCRCRCPTHCPHWPGYWLRLRAGDGAKSGVELRCCAAVR